METSAISRKKIEEIQKVIKQLIESKQNPTTETSISEQQLLVNLLSQLESLKQDEVATETETSAEAKEVITGRASEVGHTSKDDVPDKSEGNTVRSADVVKELKKVEKQNNKTHWLLSALIVLTLAWQISEVSLLMKLKEGLNHPLKSVGSMVARMVKRRKQNEEETEQSSLLAKVNGGENHLNSLSNLDLSAFMNNDEE